MQDRDAIATTEAAGDPAGEHARPAAAESAGDASADLNSSDDLNWALARMTGAADAGIGLEAVPDSGSAEPMEVAARAAAAAAPAKKTLSEKFEAFVSRLSTRNNFWHRVTSLVYLPFAFKSGIRMKRVDNTTFAAELPFRRFNKNFYNAMAGAALLGNSEIAGGMYVFGVCGGDYTVVCKKLEYRFLRPCFGPAEYRIKPKDDLEALASGGKEFNITVEMNVIQILPTQVSDRVTGELKKERRKRRSEQLRQREARPGASGDAGGPDRVVKLERLKKREKRVGKAIATFHVTPKAHWKERVAPRANEA